MLIGGFFSVKMKDLFKSILILPVFLPFSRKLTDQLPPIIAAIDSSCKTAPRNIFSGAMFTLKCGYRRPIGAVGVFMEPKKIIRVHKSILVIINGRCR